MSEPSIISAKDLKRTKRFMKELGIKRGPNTAVLVHQALARGITVSGGRDQRAELSFKGHTAWFRAGNSNLNSALAKRAVNHKGVLSTFLRSLELRIPQNYVFGRDDLRRAWAWAEPIAPVVIKPPSGRLGRLVHVDIADFVEFERAFVAVADAEGEVLVEQFVPGVDHRLTVVRNQVVGATRRFPANVIGDGSRTIAALVEAKNDERRRRANPVHKLLPLGEVELHYLQMHNMGADSVPPADQTVWLRGAANVDTGGDAVDATDDLRPHEVDYVQRVAREIPELGLGGFDVLLDRQGNDDPWILEINASPVISPHYFPWQGRPRDVAGSVLDAMFPDLPRTQGEGPPLAGAA